MGGILLLYDDGEWAPKQFLHWSWYYEGGQARRQPELSNLAPWVSAGYAKMYPDMVPEMKARQLLVEPGPDGFAAFFPGGAENNNGAWWSRHDGADIRWR